MNLTVAFGQARDIRNLQRLVHSGTDNTFVFFFFILTNDSSALSSLTFMDYDLCIQIHNIYKNTSKKKRFAFAHKRKLGYSTMSLSLCCNRLSGGMGCIRSIDNQLLIVMSLSHAGTLLHISSKLHLPPANRFL